MKRIPTSVLTRSSSYELDKDVDTPNLPSPVPAASPGSEKATPPPSYSQHLILGILRAVATDPDVLVVVPDMHHLPRDAPIREVLITWQRRGLAGVLHPDGDGGTRTLIMVEGAQEW